MGLVERQDKFTGKGTPIWRYSQRRKEMALDKMVCVRSVSHVIPEERRGKLTCGCDKVTRALANNKGE